MRFAVLIYLITSLAQAAELTEPYLSVRAAGMGNAFTPIATDSDALLINPAGLANTTGYYLTILDMGGGVDGYNVATTLANAGSGTSFANTLNSLYGTNLWGGLVGKTTFVVPGFGIGLYGNATIATDLHNPAFPVMNINYLIDYGLITGFGFDLIPSVWKIGISARRITRMGSTAPIGPATLASLSSTNLANSLANAGVGYGVDAGMILKVPGPVEPTLSVVCQNAGITSFTMTSGASAPPSIPQNVIVGGSLNINTWLLRITPVFDYYYTNNSDIELGKKLHLGMEIAIPLVSVRGGFNQGYYTLGAGLNLGVLRFDLATYGVELGEYAGQLEDRRYVLQMTWELGFDPGKFFGGDGSKKGGASRNLKQRR